MLGCLGCFKDIDELRDGLFSVVRLGICLFKENVCVANNVRLAFYVDNFHLIFPSAA